MRLPRSLRSAAGASAIGAAALVAALVCVVVVAAGGVPVASLSALPTATSTFPATPTPVDPGLTPEPSDTPRQENNDSGGPPIVLTNPAPGTGKWEYAGGGGPRFGWGGPLRPYRVAVEAGLPVSVAEFAAAVDRALGDHRGWTASGQVQFQRVSGGANFTVLLASPWTAYALCRSFVDIRIGGVPYTSCQAGSQIVINSDRYLYGSPGRFTGPLSVYRPYVINHEVGHRLGYGHVGCPGAGQLAPVMQQQTLRMQGCQPNAWPYPHVPAPPTPTPTSTATPTGTPAPTGTPTGTGTPSGTGTPTPTGSAEPTEEPSGTGTPPAQP